ncbi:MAG: hypothetical protein K6A92_02680 [Lachnospiraceae bacterium]|nr:hypothetical protein [Lachnospiraceae bacterium]
MKTMNMKKTVLKLAALCLMIFVIFGTASMRAYAADPATAKDTLTDYLNHLVVTKHTTSIQTDKLRSIYYTAINYINANYPESEDKEVPDDYIDSVKDDMDMVVKDIIADADTPKYLFLADTAATPTASYGQTIRLCVPVINYGTVALSDVIVQPHVSGSVSEWPFEISTAGSTQMIKSIPAYEDGININDYRQELGWTFKVRSDVKTGYYPVKFDVTYHINGTTEQGEELLTLYVYVKGKPENGNLDGTTDPKNTSKPRIIVTGFETEPEKVYAGSTFTLHIHIKNTSTSTVVTNALFDMQAVQEGTDKTNTYSAFLPTSGSSSVYMNSIGCGESRDITIEMTAKADLAQKPYVLDVNMKYDAGEAIDLADTASVSIPIYQESRYDTGAEDIAPSSIPVGDQSNVMFSIYNTGKTTLYNVWARFDPEVVSGGDTFVGTLSPGATGNVDTMVTGLAANDGTLKCTISYEDESGNVTTEEKTLELSIYEDSFEDMGDWNGDMGSEDDMGMYDGMDDGSQGGIKKYIGWIIAAAVVIIAVAAIFVRRHLKKKREKKEADELSEDLEG